MIKVDLNGFNSAGTYVAVSDAPYFKTIVHAKSGNEAIIKIRAKYREVMRTNYGAVTVTKGPTQTDKP